MSVSSEKKFKQALLQFKTSSNDKKRKLDNDLSFDEVKCRKLSHNNSELLSSSNPKLSVKKKELIDRKLQITSSILTQENYVVDLTENSDVDDEVNPSIRAKNNETCSQTPENSNKRKSGENSDSEKIDTNSAIDSVKNTGEKIVPKKSTTKQSEEEAQQLQKKDRELLKQENEKRKRKEEKEKERLTKLEAKEEEKRQREEERKAKEEERRLKAQAKEEERRQKEEERKAKEEEKRQKAQAREEERRQREDDKRQKEEDRRQKEEERRQKEEERRQKEEEKRQKEEEKRQREELEKKNKEKTAALFTNYFLKCKNTPTKNTSESSEKFTSTKFMPFEVKTNMRVASILRVPVVPEKMRYLDKVLSRSDLDVSSLYLAQLRSKNYVPGHSENTWPLNANDDDDDPKDETEAASRYRCKLLQFCENRRPAYWGTWRKRSKKICGRTPFKLDSKHFEYDIDSDEEWVDEEPGESLDGSDDDQESEDDYEVDNDMFVPHGYLSDEEGQPDEVSEGSPKSQKRKLNILEKQFEAEMSEKTSKLRSRVYGCIWISNNVEKNEKDDIESLLLTFRAVWDHERAPFRTKIDVENLTPTITPSSKSKITPQNIPKGVVTEFPDSLLVDLVKLVHGNKLSGQKLVDEFKLYALSIDFSLNLTKTCLLNKLREVASWIPNLGCWMVSDEIRQQHNLSDFSLTENSWKYISNYEVPSSKKSLNVAASAEKPTPAAPPEMVTTPTSSGNPKKANSITKFIRVYRASEKKMQSTESTAELTSSAEK